MLLALLLRIGNMGYKELQGDEGVIMVRAAAVLTGDDQELFLHQKGPVEILLPLAAWGLTGSINDTWARLPFTWAGWLGVAAVYALGRRFFHGNVAWLAGLLLAICGFGLAFSRIVQYQTLVMLWGALSLLSAARFRRRGRRIDLWLAAVFLAGGLLAHYDAILVAPAVAWQLLARVRDKRRIVWQHWLIAALLAGGILALFYLPYILNPNFERTFRYLLGDRVGTEESGLPFGWSGPAVWQMITFYNSLWYIIGLLAFLAIGLWRLIRQRNSLAGRRNSTAAALYFLVPALFYTLIVTDPRTHVYTLFPGAVILAAVGLNTVYEHLQQRGAGWLLWGRVLLAGWLILSTLYVYLLFIDVSPERQRTWSENRPLPFLYPTTWEEPPLFGLFGFPHQAGWRLASDLLPPEAYPYASNEEEEITNWYMSQAPRTHCPDFQTFLLVANAQDEIPHRPEWLESLFLWQEITVNGDVTLQIFGREPANAVSSHAVDQSARWLEPETVRPTTFRGDHPVEVNLADQVILAGYDLEPATAVPGEQILVRLYWQALAPFDQNNQVFVHLFDGQVRAQDDGAPECALNPTTRWEPGQIIVDPHLITIPADTPAGSLQLLTGMYDLITQVRLPRSDTLGDTIYLTDIIIRPE
jgi:hypothetical protein